MREIKRIWCYSLGEINQRRALTFHHTEHMSTSSLPHISHTITNK